MLLAALGIATSALLSAPMRTAPAQASLWDNTTQFQRYFGSWYFVEAKWCFDASPSVQDGISAYVLNQGSAAHYFKIQLRDYYDTVYAQTGWFSASPGGDRRWFPAVSPQPQSVHLRFWFWWINNSGTAEVLRELNPWSLAGSSMEKDKAVTSC